MSELTKKEMNQPVLNQRRNLMPTTYDEKLKLADLLVKSELIPSSLQGKNAVYKVFAIFVYGEEFGLSPFVALRNITVINGMPTMSADIMKALALNTGDVKEWKEGFVGERGKSSFGYEITASRHSVPLTLTARFTMEDAHRADLLHKDNWAKYYPDMLRARAVSKLVKMLFPEVFAKVYTPEEMINAASISEGEYIEIGKEPIEDVNIKESLKRKEEFPINVVDITPVEKIDIQDEISKNIDPEIKKEPEKKQEEIIVEEKEYPIPEIIQAMLKLKGYDVAKFKLKKESNIEELKKIVEFLPVYNFYHDILPTIKSSELKKEVKKYLSKLLSLDITTKEIEAFNYMIADYNEGVEDGLELDKK